ncbi:MAG TPA: hypothetical protein VMS37_18995 [Verrucomicrobiae bacterium]|nr:hypothetical protein [Verrucomicrobiae bacterium]
MTRADYGDGHLQRYSIVFLRKRSDGWYDEVRYDSHDRTRGRYRAAPHLHIKIRSEFKADIARAESWETLVAERDERAGSKPKLGRH